MTTQSTRSVIAPLAHGILDESVQDTLHVRWIITRECDCRCEYCNQWADEPNTIYMKERLLSVAHTLLSARRPYYKFSFTGGEPTLHPHLHNLVTYLYSTEMPIDISIETNGQRPIEYYKQVLKVARPHTLQLVITAHMAHVDLVHLCLLIATVFENNQFPIVRLVLDPAHRDTFNIFHTALTQLRRTVPFALHIWPLLHDGKADSRYTSEDYSLWEKADQFFSDAEMTLPASASLPVLITQCRHKDQDGKIIVSNSDLMEADVDVSGLHCCMGMNFLCVQPDGSYTPSLCPQGIKKENLWTGNRNTVHGAGQICVCASARCLYAENDVIPKFRNRAEAETCLHKAKKRALATQAASIPLPNPVCTESATEEVIRVRLKRIKPLRVATATQPTAVGVCLQHADDISTLYESIQEKSQELFLRALKVLETGNYGYLPDCSESDITNTNKNDIVLQPCIADYVTVPLEFVLNNPGQKFALSCLNGDTATLVLHPADVANTIDSNPAPLWPGTVFPNRVSVIIPTHDNEMTIRRSLDSALVQNIDDLEIIVVDNNSHDATPTILEEYHKWYPEQIRIIRLAANRGPGLARNVGMDIATGAYIAFLDSDDAMHTHFLSRALENIQTAQADVAVFNLRRVNEDGSITTLSIEPGIYCGEDAVLHLLGYTMGGYSINNRLYTTKLLRENSIRFSEIVVHHDLLFNLDATWKASRICAINEVGYTQYIRKNAVGNRNNRNPQIDAFARTIRYLQTFFANNNLDTTSGIFLQCLHRLYKSNRLYMLQTVQTASDSDLSTVLPDALLNQFSGTSEAVRLLLMDTIPSYSRGRYVLLPEEREAFLNNEIPAIPIVPTAIALKEADAPRETVPLLSLVVMDVGHDWDLDLCLERLTFQDMSRAEVLLVCTGDASKKSELEELATAFPKFRIYCAPKNASISACCSLAIEKSIASHVFLMDTTDHMSAGFVAAACELIESRQPDVILFSVVTNFGTEAVTTRRLGDGECSGLEAARHAFVEPTMRDLRGTVLRVTPMRQITWQADDIFYNETVALHLLGCSEGVITRAQVALSRMAIDPQQGGIQATRAGIQAAWAGYALLQQLAVHHNGALSAELEIFCRNHMLSALLPQYAAFWQATDKLPFPTDPSEVLRLPIAMRGLWKLCATTYQSETPTIESCSSSIVVNDLNSPPLVSIIVPIREQAEDYSCFFDALRNQALSAMEIIVLDNTSGDVTSAHLQVATKYDSRYKIVPITEKLDDATICDRGFRNASGQFMLFMNPSKKNHAEALLRGAAILQRHNKVGAVWLDSFMSGLGDVSFTPKDVLLERLQQNDTHRAWLTTGVLFRKELFEDGFKLWSTLDAPNVYLWAVYAKTHGVAELGLPTAQKQGTEQALLASAAHFAQLLKLSLCYSPDTAQGLAANTGFMQSQLLPRLKTCLAILPCEGESGLLAFSDAELCALAEANTMSRFMLDDCAALYAKQSQAPNFVTHTQLIEDATTSPLVFCGKQDSNTTTVDISVILIVENVENTLAACLDRLVAQQGNAPFEILLIDNASKDGTLNVCREYAAAHTCIRMYRTLWKTINATLRNLAINEARGTCFVFTHVGVRFAPYALSRMVEQLHTKHDCTSLATSLVFNHDGTPFSSLTKEIENCIRYSLESQTIWNRVISTAMWRKNEFAFMADGENDPAIALRLSLLGDNVWTSSLLTDEHAFDFVPAPICAEHQLDTSIRLLCDMAACAESIQIEEKRHVAIKLMHTYFRTEQNFALLHALHHVKTNENTPGLSEDQFKTLGKHKTVLSVLFSCYATLVKGAPTPPSGSPHNGTKRRTTRPVTPQPTSLSSTLAQAPSNAAFVQQDAYLPALPIELTAEEQEQAKTDPKLAEVKALSRSEAFDAKEYLRMYPDVAQSGMDPVMHYVYYGKGEGRALFYKKVANKFVQDDYCIDIIVPVYNALNDVKKCLQSVENHTDGFDIMIFIVNDNSDKATSEWLEQYCNEKKIFTLTSNKTNKGYTKSINIGLKQSTAQFVITLNSDTIVSRGWLKGLVHCMTSSPEIGVVGPLSNAATFQNVPVLYNNDNTFAINELPSNISIDEMAKIVAQSSRKEYPKVPFINGFCFMIRRAVIDTIGYMDEENFPIGYGEENDFCIRAANAGYKMVIADDVYVFHSKSKSFGQARRDTLAAQGAKALRYKHSSETIDTMMGIAKQTTLLDLIRSRIQNILHIKNSNYRKTLFQLKILFLLPVKGGSGGAHSVIQEVAEMRRLGIHACIAVKHNHVDIFHNTYASIPNYDGMFIAFSDSNLANIAQKFDIVVGTIFTSMKLVKRIVDLYPNIVPAYYIQDYEPLFFNKGTAEWGEASDSYTLLTNAVLFAKTQWVIDTVKQNHKVHVYKVFPSIDHDVYKPVQCEPSSKVYIAAMIRPKTPRRGAERTMRVLRRLHRRFGNTVEIHIFGCEDSELGFKKLEVAFAFNNHGILLKHEVANLLAHSDLFLDFSDYQAFGRTALEAMACGCISVVPKAGGANEYAKHEDNSLVVDTHDEEMCYHEVARVIMAPQIISKLRSSALSTAARYSTHLSAISECLLFEKAYATCKKQRSA